MEQITACVDNFYCISGINGFSSSHSFTTWGWPFKRTLLNGESPRGIRRRQWINIALHIDYQCVLRRRLRVSFITCTEGGSCCPREEERRKLLNNPLIELRGSQGGVTLSSSSSLECLPCVFRFIGGRQGVVHSQLIVMVQDGWMAFDWNVNVATFSLVQQDVLWLCVDGQLIWCQ